MLTHNTTLTDLVPCNTTLWGWLCALFSIIIYYYIILNFLCCADQSGRLPLYPIPDHFSLSWSMLSWAVCVYCFSSFCYHPNWPVQCQCSDSKWSVSITIVFGSGRARGLKILNSIFFYLETQLSLWRFAKQRFHYF